MYFPQINSLFFKAASALYLDFAKEKVKTGCLVSNFFAGNLTPCREQHFARELRAERDRSKEYKAGVASDRIASISNCQNIGLLLGKLKYGNVDKYR
jgi:hypothetical protein